MSQQKSQNKVLRIGIIQDGKIVQERVIKAGEGVTIGTGPKNTFVLAKSGLPATFTIFKPSGRGYLLHFNDQMKGKISSGGAVVALQKAAEDPAVARKDGVFQLPLTDQDRGKIQVGEATVLFQFVAPPPTKVAKPLQQLDFRPRIIQEDDPVFIGFLGVWSALGLVLAIWVWSLDPEPLTLDDLDDQYVKLQVQVPPEVEPEVAPEPEPDAQGPEKEVEQTDAQKQQKAAKTEGQKASADAARKSELIANSKLLTKLIGTTGEGKGVAENTWSDEELGLGNVDEALRNTAGATTVAGDATRTDGAGGNGAADVGELGKIGGGEGGDVKIKVTPKPRVSTEGGSVSASGDENAVTSSVAKYAGQLQYCYEKELKLRPGLAGRIEVRWSVSAGAVTGKPAVLADSTGDPELATCVVNKIRRWTFPADVEGEMSFPFLFEEKK